MNAKPLCIYHHGCADGFAAAWAVHTFYAGQVDLHPGIYGEAPPDVAGRDVILVDFSYKRAVLLPLIEQARTVLILDHHKSAEEDLVGLPSKCKTVFDMARSGAMITWDHFFPGEMPPPLFDFIQDRDLWQFRLPLTREIIAALYSYPMTIDQWDQLMLNPALSTLRLEHEGRAILRAHSANVASLISATRRTMWFGQVQVPVANVPYMYASDVGHELSKGHPFAATYYDDETGRRWSLRSQPEGADVKQIAVALGGGGHEHAAGFRMTVEQAIDFELSGGVTA